MNRMYREGGDHVGVWSAKERCVINCSSAADRAKMVPNQSWDGRIQWCQTCETMNGGVAATGTSKVKYQKKYGNQLSEINALRFYCRGQRRRTWSGLYGHRVAESEIPLDLAQACEDQGLIERNFCRGCQHAVERDIRSWMALVVAKHGPRW